MHLNKILEQIKRHQSPTEAIDKLATALEKHEGSLLENGCNGGLNGYGYGYPLCILSYLIHLVETTP